MIQRYLHSVHICVVSILFLEDSIHCTECAIKMQQTMTVVKEMQTSTQTVGVHLLALILGNCLAIGKLFHLPITSFVKWD